MKRIGTGKLREQNKQLLFRYLVGGNEVTKKELSNQTGLTIVTVGNILNDFCEKEIIKMKESIIPKKGRPTITYTLNPQYFHALSFFIDRKKEINKFHYRVSNALLETIEEGQEEVSLLNEDTLTKYIQNIINRDKKIKIIGIGIPAIISDNIVIESDIEELQDLNIRDLIESKTNIKTIVKNEMNYCAYGFYNTLEKKQDVCYMAFPYRSGPGCGTIINGQLLEGQNNIAGEILYLPFFEYLKHKNASEIRYDNTTVAMSVCCLASIINPSYIIVSGEGLKEIELESIKDTCLQYIPQKFMPKICYVKEYEKDYFRGIQRYINEEYFK